MSNRGRFIAGAVCTECRAVDRVVVETTLGRRQRRCVACGFSEPVVDTVALEPASRFSSRGNAAPSTEKVRFVDRVRPDRDSSGGSDSE